MPGGPTHARVNRESTHMQCPRCGGDMKMRDGLKGAFWGCRRYPDCEGTRDISDDGKHDDEPHEVGVHLESAQLAEVLAEMRAIRHAVESTSVLAENVNELTAELKGLNRTLAVFALNKLEEWERRQEEVKYKAESEAERLMQ